MRACSERQCFGCLGFIGLRVSGLRFSGNLGLQWEFAVWVGWMGCKYSRISLQVTEKEHALRENDERQGDHRQWQTWKVIVYLSMSFRQFPRMCRHGLHAHCCNAAPASCISSGTPLVCHKWPTVATAPCATRTCETYDASGRLSFRCDLRRTFYLIPVPLGRKKDPFCLYIRKPITQKVKRIPNTDLV